MKAVSVGLGIIICLALMPVGYAAAQGNATLPMQDANKISLDIKGMDILDVFRMLSMKSGLNIVAGKNVSGRVNLFLKDVDMWDAFDIIIAANDLAYEKRGNIIYVMTQRDYELNYGRKYEDKRVVKSVKLRYVKAAEVSKSISQIKTNIGRVISDDTSDTLVIIDIPEVMVDMEKIIKELDVPLTTKVYSLQYATADKIKDKLTEMLTKNVGSLKIDERTNKVAITDLEERIQEFDKVIAAFDEKHKEVLIEAKILQITLNDDYQMGINWDAVFNKMQKNLHHIATLGVNLRYAKESAVIPTTSSTSATGGALQIGQLNSEGYQAVIQAIREYGQTNLLSSPRIVALNNQEAKILVGTNQPYATRSISQTSGGASNIEAENVTFLDLGIKLNVVPTINEDNYITMKIKPEVSSMTDVYTIQSSKNEIPIVKTTTTETTVMVKDGATILIGGLIEDNIREYTKEVPGLAKLPLVGNLFRTKTTGSGDTTNPEKTELVIFLTPHIITGDDSKDMLSVKKIANDVVMKKMEANKELTEEDLEDVAIDEITPQQYYSLISDIIRKKVQSYKPDLPAFGEVVILFTLRRDGRLAAAPMVYLGENKQLSEIGIKSITEMSPFPPFPQGMGKNRETFQIAISYE